MTKSSITEKPIIVVSDVDGCLTNGQFIYTANGKVAKVFGANDHDGIRLCRKNGIEVEFITADKVGLPIVNARMKELKCKLSVFSETERVEYLKNLRKDHYVVFIGDGAGDAATVRKGGCDLFVCPANAMDEAKAIADYISTYRGAEGAFWDMCKHICSTVFDVNYERLY